MPNISLTIHPPDIHAKIMFLKKRKTGRAFPLGSLHTCEFAYASLADVFGEFNI